MRPCMLILSLWLAVMIAACGSEGGGAGGGDSDSDSDADSDSDGDTDTDGPFTTEVEVPADIYWVNSGLFVREGDEISITAAGSWTIWEGTVDEYGPEGLGYDVYGCMHGELVAMVGLHWNDDQICVGAEKTFEAPRDGILYLAANDGGREDNAGSVTAEVTSEADLTPSIPAGDIAAFDYDTVTADMLELEGDNIILTLSTSYVSSRPDDAEAALDTFESWYDLHAELAGAVPYNGQRVRYYPDADILDIGAWGLSGNPIRVMQEEGFLDVADPEYGVWGYVHELGHDFSFIDGGAYMVGGGPVEGWCNVWTSYALDMQDRPEADRWQQQCADIPIEDYLATGTYDQLTNDPWIPLCLLMTIQTDYGWQHYIDFFDLIFQLPEEEQIETSDSAETRWGFVRDRMNQISGDDLTQYFVDYHVPLP